MARLFLTVIDGCGIGALPDTEPTDRGAATIPNVAREVGGLVMPHSASLGLGNIAPIAGVPTNPNPVGSFGKMAEVSAGKDSTTGHWELAGVVLARPFPTYPDGFPAEVVSEFERRTGAKTIGNVAASGTEVIARLGEEHLRTGALILYTSADSVFQLAAHENLYPRPALYALCEIAREMLDGEHAVGRVIARPFLGTPGNFTRTDGRKDFSLTPPTLTLLDQLQGAGKVTYSIGKVWDLFAGRGISKSIKTTNNEAGFVALTSLIQDKTSGDFVFTNLVDFDQDWGHRNDVIGFARGLESFDRALGVMLPLLSGDDIFIVTADHGCDPTLSHTTDHTREYVPLLVYGKRLKPGVNLGTRSTFADVAATVAEFFVLPHAGPGISFLPLVKP